MGYDKSKQVIKEQLEYVLADRNRLIGTAVQSVIELLRADPQKFHSYYYNRSTIHPENNEEPFLVQAEQLYAKMSENFTNRVVTNQSDNISSVSTSIQQEL